jgi:hypothetical protein
MSHQEHGLRPTDVAILDHLSEHGLDYPAVIAAAHAVDTDRTRRRADALASRGLVESVSPEVVYRITARGERRLAAYRDGTTGLVADD